MKKLITALLLHLLALSVSGGDCPTAPHTFLVNVRTHDFISGKIDSVGISDQFSSGPSDLTFKKSISNNTGGLASLDATARFTSQRYNASAKASFRSTKTGEGAVKALISYTIIIKTPTRYSVALAAGGISPHSEAVFSGRLEKGGFVVLTSGSGTLQAGTYYLTLDLDAGLPEKSGSDFASFDLNLDRPTTTDLAFSRAEFAPDPKIATASEIKFTVSNAGDATMVPTSIKGYWATGKDITTKIGGAPVAFTSALLSPLCGRADFEIPTGILQGQPKEAKYLVLVVNEDKEVIEAAENQANNTTFVELPALELNIFSIEPALIGGTHSFIATDLISIKAKTNPNKPVSWSVNGLFAGAGIGGFPNKEVRISDGNGISTFSFRPAENPIFSNNRHTAWARGSRTANPAIGFEVIAELDGDGQTIQSKLSEAELGPLLQDDVDTLRQEYLDYQIPVPGREVIVPSLGAGYNRGNYHVQVSIGLPTHFNAIVAEYRNSDVVVSGKTVAMPQSAEVVISSGFRNPQRNKAVGSVHPDSKHTRGSALDLQPVPISVLVEGHRTQLSLHGNLYPALYEAGATQGKALAEQSALPVAVGDSRENHIHVQWINSIATLKFKNFGVTSSQTNPIQAHADVLHDGTNFIYMLYNDEPANSPLRLNLFHLVVNAHVEVKASPRGWGFQTDNRTFVDWICTNDIPPYSDDIGPGTSIGGFVVTSDVPTTETSMYALASWSEALTNSGPVVVAEVESPAVASVEPELQIKSNERGVPLLVTLAGIPWFSYSLQISTNLLDWVSLGTNVSPFTINEPNGLDGSKKFFRGEFIPDSVSAPAD